MGQKLGHQVFIVLEQLSEVTCCFRSPRSSRDATAGVRISCTEGSGRWAKSGGEKSKFGAQPPRRSLRLVDKLKSLGRLDILKLIHFHLGSQITAHPLQSRRAAGSITLLPEAAWPGVDITHVTSVETRCGRTMAADRHRRRAQTTTLQEYATM